MTANPYSYLGKPIRKFQHFYGRKRELAEVTDDVRNGQCVSVVGIRRIGKTSLLFQLLDPDARSAYQLSDEILCVYVGCERLAKMPPGEIYAEIMRRVYRRLDKYHRAELEKPGETLSYRDFEDNILELHDAGLKLVLLLDEFERFASNPRLDIDFFLGLRALHIEHELTYVIASLCPVMELAFSQEEILSSPFPNIFDSVRLGLFSEPEARELIRVAGVFSPEVEDSLLELTGGHPLALQYACHFAFARQQETGTALTHEDRFVFWNQTQEAMEKHYRYYWKHLSNDQKRVLAAPTHFAKQIKEDTPVANLFKDLVTLGVLVVRPNGGFSYAGRALAEFVRRERNHDKSLWAISASDLVGQRLGQYQITARLGRGGMADVYKAHQPSLDRDVAIKVMLPYIASDEGFSARFQREARVAAALRHPHIVQIYDFGQENGIYYMVMEYIPGENLKAHLQAVSARGEQKMPIDGIVRIITQIGEALHYAHDQGLLHRDVKPSNVMLTPTGEAILTDFGLAKIIEGTQFTSSNIVGTPAYMAPEQINGSSTLDQRTDVYALGVMLYEMATGQVPFDADTPFAVIFRHLQEPLPDPRQLRPDLPDFLVRVIEKALAKEPEQRYQTVQEMLDALERGEITFVTPRHCWGVLVGVNHYQDPISSLTVCANDVSLVCDALCATSGYERARLRLLADGQEATPTKSEILANLQAAAESAAEEDLLLFYFSGHGIAEGNEGYLLPSDARYGVLADTSIPIRRVTEIILESEARAKVMVLDACHSGAQIGKASLTMTPEFIQRVFEEAEGMVVLASCRQGQVSWEWPEENCSVFTHYVLEGISGAADWDGKGFVTMNDLARHVTDRVKLWAVQRGCVQIPTMQAQVVGDIILVDHRPKPEE